MLYLASTSPRRRHLLAAAGISYAAILPGPELAGAGAPIELARSRARSKAAVDPDSLPDEPQPVLILAVDTVVDLDGREFGKPGNLAEAAAMLRALSGREHWVHTALCLRRVVAEAKSAETDELWQALASARVRCDPLGDVQLQAYLDSGDWRCKAGAYGIQGEAGQFMHLRSGDLDTVIGLPIGPLLELLRAADFGRTGEGTWQP